MTDTTDTTDTAAPYQIHPGTLFKYTAGVYCGVFMKEATMRRLAKLQAAHLEQVRRILADGADRGELFPAGWTLHYPEGEQTVVHFIDTAYSVSQRIQWATISQPPEALPLVFVADGTADAKRQADARHEEIGNEMG